MSIDALQQFIQSTETGTPGISIVQQNRSVEYPFLFINTITDVELAYLTNNLYIHTSKTADNEMRLYLKIESGYRLLGYIALSYSSILHISYLVPHNVFIKTDKETTRELTGELFDSLLLTN